MCLMTLLRIQSIACDLTSERKWLSCSHCMFAEEKLVTLHRPMGSDFLEYEMCVGELGQRDIPEHNLLAHP